MKGFFALITSTVVMFIAGQITSPADSEETNCTFPSVAEGEPTFFSCIFGVDMMDPSNRKDVIMKKQWKVGDGSDDVIDCYWMNDNDGYFCKVKNPRFYFNYQINYNSTVYLPEARPEDEGTYICDVTSRYIVTCDFRLLPPPVTEAESMTQPQPSAPTTPTEGKGEKEHCHPTPSGSFSHHENFYHFGVVLLIAWFASIL